MEIPQRMAAIQQAIAQGELRRAATWRRIRSRAPCGISAPAGPASTPRNWKTWVASGELADAEPILAGLEAEIEQVTALLSAGLPAS